MFTLYYSGIVYLLFFMMVFCSYQWMLLGYIQPHNSKIALLDRWEFLFFSYHTKNINISGKHSFYLHYFISYDYAWAHCDCLSLKCMKQRRGCSRNSCFQGWKTNLLTAFLPCILYSGQNCWLWWFSKVVVSNLFCFKDA